MLAGPSAICSDNRGVVQPLAKAEVNCVASTHKHANLLVFVRNRINDLVEERALAQSDLGQSAHCEREGTHVR